MDFITSQFENVISDCISLDVNSKQRMSYYIHLPTVLLVVDVVGKLVDCVVVSETTKFLFTLNYTLLMV